MAGAGEGRGLLRITGLHAWMLAALGGLALQLQEPRQACAELPASRSRLAPCCGPRKALLPPPLAAFPCRHTCPKTGVRWLCEPCFNKVRVALKREVGQGGKKRKQPAGLEEQTPEAEDGGAEATEAGEGGGKGRQASTRPAQPPHRRKKPQQPRAPQKGDPPTPAGPDPAAAAKGRGAAAAAAAHHAAGALALLASQPASSGPEPPQPSRPLHPEASWPLQYARLQFLLADSGVAEAAAQARREGRPGLPGTYSFADGMGQRVDMGKGSVPCQPLQASSSFRAAAGDPVGCAAVLQIGRAHV